MPSYDTFRTVQDSDPDIEVIGSGTPPTEVSWIDRERSNIARGFVNAGAVSREEIARQHGFDYHRELQRTQAEMQSRLNAVHGPGGINQMHAQSAQATHTHVNPYVNTGGIPEDEAEGIMEITDGPAVIHTTSQLGSILANSGPTFYEISNVTTPTDPVARTRPYNVVDHRIEPQSGRLIELDEAANAARQRAMQEAERRRQNEAYRVRVANPLDPRQFAQSEPTRTWYNMLTALPNSKALAKEALDVIREHHPELLSFGNPEEIKTAGRNIEL